MSKITDFFSMTRRERVGTLVVLLMLAFAILFSYCSGQWREREQPECQPGADVFRKLVDSVGVQKPLDTSSGKVGSPVKGEFEPSAGQSRRAAGSKFNKDRSGNASENLQQRPANGVMDEVPSF